jgi:uncharacterized protein YjbI with pentapeptide repeats
MPAKTKSAKSPKAPSPLTGLAGKKVLTQGRFSKYERTNLHDVARAQGATIAGILDKSVDYVVLPSLPPAASLQKAVNVLNARGAAIQVLDSDAFTALAALTDAQFLELLRAGGKAAAEVLRILTFAGAGGPATRTITGEHFDSADLTDFYFAGAAFHDCSFRNAILRDSIFGNAARCDFSHAVGDDGSFDDVPGSAFAHAHLPSTNFNGSLADTDFSSARLDKSTFYGDNTWKNGKISFVSSANTRFAKASLREAEFSSLALEKPDFQYADLASTRFDECPLDTPTFRNAILRGTSFINCTLMNADFTGADLRNASFGGTELVNAKFDGADLAGCSFAGATLAGTDFSGARNYTPPKPTGAVGPALTKLDAIAKKAHRILISFHVETGKAPGGESVFVDTSSLGRGYARLGLPSSFRAPYRSKVTSFSALALELASYLAGFPIRYETVKVTSAKSPTAGRELHKLVLAGLAEAFNQPLPADDVLAAATKKVRGTVAKQGAAQRRKRQMQRAAAEKAAAKRLADAKAKVNQKIARSVGAVTDTASFLKALGVRIELPKIQKAASMLKASGFKLFHDLTDAHLAGVVKSQTDPDLVYACRLNADGTYACCTQNLNICGGLRGAPCKHLLVLMIGLVQAGELDPAAVDAWLSNSTNLKPALDKEQMGEIFLKYKGAEAGEVDWRPTETMPEDYYAL